MLLGFLQIKRLIETLLLGSRSNLLRLDLDLDLIFCLLRLGSRFNLLRLDLDLVFCLISVRLGLDFLRANMAPSSTKIVASSVLSASRGQAPAHIVSEAPALIV